MTVNPDEPNPDMLFTNIKYEATGGVITDWAYLTELGLRRIAACCPGYTGRKL
jgi:hypothetical protein